MIGGTDKTAKRISQFRLSLKESLETIEAPPIPVKWKNVRYIDHTNYYKMMIHKEVEESEKQDNYRTNDLSTYLAQLSEICSFKISNRIIGQKMRCYIPKEYFDKRNAGKKFDKDDERNTSLDVHLPNDLDDYVSKQGRFRRGLQFRKFMRDQEIEDMTLLPFIEEDALDLVAMLGSSNVKPLTLSRSLESSRQPDGGRLPYIAELNDKPKAGILVSCYVKDHILKLPILMANAERIRELYTNCILKDEHLNKLFSKKKDMLPKDLLDYIADFGTNNDTDNTPKIIKDEIADRDQFFHTSMNVHANDILGEIEIDSLEFTVFINPCYILNFSKVMPDINLMNLQDTSQIELILQSIINGLENDILNPVSASRKQLMSAFLIANSNAYVSLVFIDLLPLWLESLTKGFFSPHSPIREDTCYCIGFLFNQSKFMLDLLNFHSSEFVYDIIAVIFKAIDHYSKSFAFFYSLIGYIMDGCPLMSILMCICDKGPFSKNFLMRKQWPKFVVLACKHWPNESFKSGQIAIKRLQDLLEKFFLQPITRRASKMALAYIGRRFDRRGMVCTHWNLNKCGPPDDT